MIKFEVSRRVFYEPGRIVEVVQNRLRELWWIMLPSCQTATWRRMNKPHPSLSFDKVIEEIETFAKSFKGALISETMLVKGMDQIEEIEEIASLVKRLGVWKAYLAIPIRPPAERVEPPPEQDILRAYRFL